MWREDCPKCGAGILIEEYYPSAIGLTCPQCGCALTPTETWVPRDQEGPVRTQRPRRHAHAIHPAA
ncbi:MAG: hypothetical protein EXR51_06615 [Dehalococcoidia bacterium]|nr:hypothetical protein [Dehalococcoidia bacterium]